MQLLVYTPKITPRVEYIFSILLNAIGVQRFQVTQDVTFFNTSESYKINYSSALGDENILWIEPVHLLFEIEIKEPKIDVFKWNETKAFFKTPNGDLPFDIFAASFYLITRYEEYLPHKLDMYGRYAHENSLASKEGFLKMPLVNIWLQDLKKIIVQKFPSLHLTPQTFHFLPTYDIDIAWSYLHKGWRRNLGGLLRSMADGEWALASERINVVFGNQKDPFDSYQWLHKLHEEYQLKSIYFFLLADKNKDYDKNILPAKDALQKLIQQHNYKYCAGIHPSWQSGDKMDLLQKEIKTLEKITGKKAKKSRQHYIRMQLPDTYRRLIEAGITEDYSMGYGSINGFRASYCLPYNWYDLQKEETTSLTIYPFCFMDANSYYEQHQTPGEASNEMHHYYQVTKSVNGLLITVWHNHFLGTDRMFKGWKEVYRTFCLNLDLLDLKD
jgi:hypothetical protein